MIQLLRPIEAYMCPSLKRLVPKSECEGCECMIEIRNPCHRWAVKGDIGENKKIPQ